jgi:predicted TIM-barrel fold metal-dependent hydrolase
VGRDPAEHQSWLNGHIEEILDPERTIIDPHHHLWPHPVAPYEVSQLQEDTSDGHRVAGTVFVECMSQYRPDGPEHLRCVGETAYVARLAGEAARTGGSRILGIVGAADLRRTETLDETISEHLRAGEGLFRGIRHSAAHDPSPDIRISHHRPPPGLYRCEAFRTGFRLLARHDLTFDAWLYHPQIDDLVDLAGTFPETRIVCDHFGGPLGVGPYAGRRRQVFDDWLGAVRRLSRHRNVFMKLGGMAMAINGYDWRSREKPPSSETMVAEQGDYYRAAIDLFTPERCMFESNFPMDRQAISYRTLFNAFKRIAASYSEDEKNLLFAGVARQVYRL